MASVSVLQDPAVDATQTAGPTAAAHLKMLAHWISLGASVGGLVGLGVGGVGGRLAMLLLRFTTDVSVKGVESDDGFTMGRFDVSSTMTLLLVCSVLGSIGGLIVAFGRPFLPQRYMLAAWPLAAGAIVGATIIKSDGVDFTLLDPKPLAIAMFVAIPAAGAFLIAWLMNEWAPWWGRNWKATSAAAIPALPALVFFPLGITVVVIALVWLLALRVSWTRRLSSWRSIRALAVVVFVALTGLGLMALSNDVREIL